jgi:DNA-binding response OmpR family regulator
LEVSDGGKGIHAEDLPHVFDRFYQSDQAQGERGTGIGLALCKELVELHGGSIAVESVVGKGSTFLVTLPLHQENVSQNGQGIEIQGSADLYLVDSQSETDPMGIGLEQVSEKGITAENARNVVLVVEDNDDVRAYIRSCIPQEYQVIEARDGKQGLEMALEWVPDLVLTDLMMPIMDGIELTARLKKEEASSHIPIIMLTSRAEDDTRLEGLETGADAYLTKPFIPAELQIRIKKLIGLRQTLRDKYRGEMLLGPRKVEAASMEETFLLKVQDLIQERLGDEQFAVVDMAEAVGLSQVQFNRKFKALTGATPNKFLRSYRLGVARQLIEQNAGTMAEIGFQVGFRSAAYFSKCFADEFGVSPSEWKGQ